MNLEYLALELLGTPKHLHFDDLVSVGNLVLLEAGENPPSEEIVKYRMIDYLRENTDKTLPEESKDGRIAPQNPSWDYDGR